MEHQYEKPHYRLYYFESGQLKKAPSYMKNKHYNIDVLLDDIKFYYKLRLNKSQKIKQFVIVYWEKNYTDSIERIIEEVDFKFD